MKTIFDWHDELTNAFINQNPIELKKSLRYDEFCWRIRGCKIAELDGNIIYFWNSFDFTLDLFAKAKALMVKKNHDYAGISDPFSNFRTCQNVGLCTVLVGLLVRIGDKVSRLENLKVREAKVKDESVQDTLIDVINYCVLMRAYLDANP